MASKVNLETRQGLIQDHQRFGIIIIQLRVRARIVARFRTGFRGPKILEFRCHGPGNIAETQRERETKIDTIGTGNRRRYWLSNVVSYLMSVLIT